MNKTINRTNRNTLGGFMKTCTFRTLAGHNKEGVKRKRRMAATHSIGKTPAAGGLINGVIRTIGFTCSAVDTMFRNV